MPDSTQVSIATVSIMLHGSSDPLIERDLEELVIDSSQNLPSMATIRLHDPSLKWADDTRFKIGATVELKLSPSKSMQKVNPGIVFSGEIIALEPSFSALGTNSFTVRAYDKSHRLHIGTKLRTFQKVKNSDIVRKIAQEAGFRAGKLPTAANDPVNDYIIQNNISDFEFLSVRAKRAGCVLKIDGDTLHFASPEDLQVAGIQFDMGESLREFSVRNSGTLQSKKIEVTGWNVSTKQEIIQFVQQPDMIWSKTGLPENGGANGGSVFGNSTLSLTTFVPQTVTEAKALVAGAYNDQQGRYIEADGIAYGHPQLLAGATVKLNKLGTRFTGTYYVTSATHIYNSAGYEVHFTVAGPNPQSFNQLLNPAEGGEKEPGSIPNVVIGIVTNNKDPNNWGRVRVKFPWLTSNGGQHESNWARVAAPSAGANRGFFWVPEVNDEVLVAFEHGNVNYPYILGSLWNGKDNPPEGNNKTVGSANVDLRIIRSRTGHTIQFSDKAGSESIFIEDKTKKNSILIDSVKNNIDIRADGNLTIDVKGSISIKAAQGIKMETPMAIELNAKTTFKVDATTSISMKTGGVMVDGNSITLNATGTLAAKGTLITLN